MSNKVLFIKQKGHQNIIPDILMSFCYVLEYVL